MSIWSLNGDWALDFTQQILLSLVTRPSPVLPAHLIFGLILYSVHHSEIVLWWKNLHIFMKFDVAGFGISMIIFLAFLSSHYYVVFIFFWLYLEIVFSIVTDAFGILIKFNLALFNIVKITEFQCFHHFFFPLKSQVPYPICLFVCFWFSCVLPFHSI